MNDYHCLEIEFPDVDLSEYSYPHIKAKISKVNPIAQIYLSNDNADLQSVHVKIGLVSSLCKKNVSTDIFPQRYRRFAICARKVIPSKTHK